MLAALLPLVPLLAQVVPQIASWLGGEDAEVVASQIASAVAAVAGGTDEAAVAAAMADPAQRAALIERLARIAAEREKAREEAITARLVAGLADIAHARETTLRLAQARSPLAWLAPATCGLIFGLFAFVVVAEVFGYGAGMSEATRRLLDYLAIAAAGYAIGSSAGSAAKDQRQAAGMAAAAETAAAGVRAFAGGRR
jgi:hypothetical protein